MKENRKLLKEVLKDIRNDMTDEEVLRLLADSKISISPKNEKEKYFLGSYSYFYRSISGGEQNAYDTCDSVL